jgi:hypothetical protein
VAFEPERDDLAALSLPGEFGPLLEAAYLTGQPAPVGRRGRRTAGRSGQRAPALTGRVAGGRWDVSACIHRDHPW